MVAGATIIFFPRKSGLSPKYFWPVMHPDNVAKTGHMWLFAPPFKVVDISLFSQSWNRRQSKYIPPVIASERWEPAQAKIDDLMENELVDLIYKETGRPPTTANLTPELLQTMRKFPPFSISLSGIHIKYVPTQVSAMDGNLEQMRNLCLRGHYPAALYGRFLEQRANQAAVQPKGDQ
jgi:hypothetical protein